MKNKSLTILLICLILLQPVSITLSSAFDSGALIAASDDFLDEELFDDDAIDSLFGDEEDLIFDFESDYDDNNKRKVEEVPVIQDSDLYEALPSGVDKNDVRNKKREINASAEKDLEGDGQKINFSARNIPVRDAFATLARISGKSITVSGDIQERQKISVVEIKNQQFPDAFMSLVRAAGVDFVVRGDDSFTILRPNNKASSTLFSSLESSQINKDLPLVERTTDVIYDNQDLSSIIKDLTNKYGVDIMMTVQPSERVTVKLSDSNVFDSLKLILAGSQYKYTFQDGIFVIYNATNKNFDLYKDIAYLPLEYLSSEDIIKLLPNDLKQVAQASERQNALIAEGSKVELAKLERFIQAVDRPLPQVELDVKLVEVSDTFRRALTPYQDTFALGRFGALSDPLDVTSGGNGQGFTANFGPDEFRVFNGTPQFSENSSDNEIKVSQKLLVTSGKSAKINFDEDVNVVLGTAQGGTSGSVGVVQTQNIQRVTAGNSLDITPIVGKSGVITLEVEVEVSANGPINDTTGVPVSTTRRKISSEIQAENDKTIVIGGIFDDQKGRTTTNQIPILGWIPILRDLFGNSTREKSKTELMILITPHLKKPHSPEIEMIYPTT